MTPGRPDRRPWRDIRADVDDELAFHLEMRERDARERGLAGADARRDAERRFGDLERIRREVHAIDEGIVRERRRAGMFRDFWQDVVYALRGMRRAPGFTVVALVTLAIGIGATTSIFSVVNAALLKPLPFPHPEQLVFLWNRTASGDPEPLGPGRLMDFRSQTRSFEGFAAISHISYTLTGHGDPELIPGSSVSSTFFDVLGVPPLLGDTFHAGHADPGAVVLGYGLWVRRFGADPAIVGQTIVLSGRARQVMAVMPKTFAWPFITAKPSGDGGPELWVPGGPGDIPRAGIDEDRDMRGFRNTGYLRAVARLRPGVAPAQADAEVRAIGARLSKTYPQDGNRTAMLVGLRDQFFGSMERPLYVLSGAVLFVLALACANVASLLLGRGSARRRDLALRRALGATRVRIVRQLLTESIVLGIAGGTAGVLFAWAGTSSLTRIVPADVADLQMAISVPVLAFALLVALASGMAFGLMPAVQFSRGDLSRALAEGSTRSSGSRRSTRVRDVLVCAEIAIALVLLVGSALLVRSFLQLTRVDTGIDTHNLLTFSIKLAGERAEYQSRQVQFYDALQQSLAALPGVRAVGSAVTLPIGGDDFGTAYLVEGRPEPRPGDEPHGGYQVVMPGYFAAMGIPIKEGRDVRLSDTRDAQPIALVNETLARRQWPGRSAVGQRVRLGPRQPWMTIVGVVGDIRHLGPAVPPRAEIYQAASQNSFPFMAFVVRTSGDPYASVPAIRRAVAALDPALPIADVKTMDEHVQRALSRPRFVSTLVTAFGVVAVVLAMIGIYGVMAWSVAQQRQEIAIRMALGAERASVLLMVLRRAAVLAAAGVAAGLLAAPLATRPLAALLYGIRPEDLGSFAAATAGIAIVSLLAAAVPAMRAARIEPGSAVKL